MTLQFLINHYREPLEIVWRLLHSIEEQIGLDNYSIEILICTDGYEYELIDPGFSSCRFPIRYFVQPHYGVCKTRNALLDAATADYLIFCDCDDMFSRNDGVCKLLESAIRIDADIVGSDYDVEFKSSNKFIYQIAHRNTSRIHSKLFKRQYLIDQNLRFPDEMAFSGDMYFLYLAYHLTDKIVWIPENLYVWKWMPISVTRGKTYYSVRTYDMVLYCYTLVLRELIRREQKNLCENLLVRLINTAYIDYFSQRFDEAPDELSMKARASIRSMVQELHNLYLAVCLEKRRRNYINLLLVRRTYGPPGKFVGIPAWITEVVQSS